MQLIVTEKELIDVLVIDLSENEKKEIIKVQDARNLGQISSKQYRLKVLCAIMRQEVGD